MTFNGRASEVNKKAERGVPSLVWRAGQERRLAMLNAAAPPNKWIVTISITFGTLMGAIDASIVNVAINNIRGSVGATLEEITWTTTGFVVSWDAVPGAQAYSIWVQPGSFNYGRLDPSTTSWTFASGTTSSSYTVKLDVLVNGPWATMAD